MSCFSCQKRRPRITRQDSCSSKSPFKYNLHTGCEVIFISNNNWASSIGPLFHDYMGNIDCEEVMTWKAEWNNHERFWKQLTGTVTSKASHRQSQPSPPARPPHTNTHYMYLLKIERDTKSDTKSHTKSKFADMLITLSSRFFSWLPYLQTKFILHLGHCYQLYWIITP